MLSKFRWKFKNRAEASPNSSILLIFILFKPNVLIKKSSLYEEKNFF